MISDEQEDKNQEELDQERDFPVLRKAGEAVSDLAWQCSKKIRPSQPVLTHAAICVSAQTHGVKELDLDDKKATQEVISILETTTNGLIQHIAFLKLSLTLEKE